MSKSTLLVLSALLTLVLTLAPLSVQASSRNDDHHSNENEEHDRDHHENHHEDCHESNEHHDDKDHHGDDDKKHKNHNEDRDDHHDRDDHDDDDDHECNTPSPSPSPSPTATVTPSPTPVLCNGTNVWATSVVSATQGVKKDGTAIALDRSNSQTVLGPNDKVFYSLGKNGTITVGFTNPIKNLTITDFNIFEYTNGPLSYPQEDGKVEVSLDGTTWFTVPTVIHSNVNALGVNPVDFSSTGLTTIKYVRITDETNFDLNTVDGVNGGNADGIDVDAVQGLEESCQ